MKNKLNAAALLALSASLAACSSGGGSSSTPQSTPVVSAEQKAAAEAAKKLAAEKAAAEAAAKKAAAEAAAKKAAEEAAKKAAAEAAAKKAAAEAAAKKAAEEAAKKAAAEKAAEEAAKKLAAEKAAAEAAAKKAAEEAAKKAAEEAAKKAAAEKAAAEAAAKKAAEEAAKKAAEEAARKAAEAAALEAKMKPLIEKAQKVGFSDSEAKAYALKNVALSDAVAEQNLKTEIKAKADRDRALRIPYVDGHAINGKVVAYDSSLKQSGTDVAFKKAAREKYEALYHTNYDDLELDITPQTGYVVIDGKTVKQTRIGKEYIAYQPYSVVYGNLLTNVSVDGKAIVNPADKPYFRIDEIAGYAVTDATLPTEGKATYKLASYSLGNAGHVTPGELNKGISVGSDFQYIVDFDGKSGHGNFTAWGYLAPGQSEYTKHMVTLDQGPLRKMPIDNVTTYGVESSLSVKTQGGEYGTDGKYIVGLFGPEAQELAGRVTINAPLARITNGTQAGRKDQVEVGILGTRGEIKK